MHHLMIVCCNSWFLLLRVLWKLISSDPGGFVLRVFLLFVVLPTNCCSKKKESGAIPWSQPPVVRNSHAIFWLLAPSDWPTSPARIEDTRMHHLMIVCCNSWFLLLRVLWKLISSDPGGFVLRVFLLFVVLPTNCCSKKDEVVQFLYIV